MESKRKELLFSLRNCPLFRDFCLIHRGKKYYVNSLLITSISPKISKLYFENSQRMVEVPPINIDFDQFIDLIYGGDIKIDINNCRFFKFVAEFLEIKQLYDSAASIVSKSNTIDNVIKFADEMISHDIKSCEEIDLLAKNFEEIVNNDLMNMLSAPLLIEIISSPYFDVHDYKLITFIVKLIQNDPIKYKELDSYIHSAVNDDCSTFIVLNHPYYNLNRKPKSIIGLVKEKYTYYDTDYTLIYPFPGGEINGLVKRFVKDYGSLPNRRIYVSSTEPIDENYSVLNLFDGSDNTMFHSKDQPDSFIEIRLLHCKFYLTHYALKAGNSDICDNKCPVSWTIEGSNNGLDWVILDEVEYDISVYKLNELRVFKVRSICTSFEYLRFVQKESINRSDNGIFLSLFDLYGRVVL